MDADELELLLSLDGAAYEMAPGLIVEFTVKRTVVTPQRSHGISYALVLRPKPAGAPWVKTRGHAERPGPRARPSRSLAPDGA